MPKETTKSICNVPEATAGKYPIHDVTPRTMYE